MLHPSPGAAILLIFKRGVTHHSPIVVHCAFGEGCSAPSFPGFCPLFVHALAHSFALTRARAIFSSVSMLDTL